VNGKATGFLTAYHVHSKGSTDIASEDATQPIISPDGKRVMYITLPARDRNELWVSDIDGATRRNSPLERIWEPEPGLGTIFTCLLMTQEPAPRTKPT